MDTLDRYLTREFFLYFSVILVGLVVIFLGIKFFEEFWRLEMSGSRMFMYYIYQVPGALKQFVPVAVLMTTLLILTTLSRQNEILAIYSGGMGIIRISSTFIGIVAVISTLSFLVFDSLVPACQKRIHFLKQNVNKESQESYTFYPSRYWYRLGDKVFNIDRYRPETKTLEGITLYLISDGFEIEGRVSAQRAKYDGKEWILEKGFSIAYPQGEFEGKYPVATPFDLLGGLINQTPNHFREFTDERKYLRLKDLRHRIERHRLYGLDTTTPATNYHERLALVFSPLVFVMIGIPLATKPLRHGTVARGVGFTFIIILIYLLSFKISLSAGKAGILPPIVAGWLTNVVFLFYAVFIIVKRR